MLHTGDFAIYIAAVDFLDGFIEHETFMPHATTSLIDRGLSPRTFFRVNTDDRL
jgi:hypothetical protein